MFDPALPANGSPNSSAEMRAQLTGLFDLINAVPAADMAAFLARLSAILRLNFTGLHVPNTPYSAGDVASFNDQVVRYVLALDDVASSPPISFPIPWPWVLIPIELGQVLAAGSSANSNAVALLGLTVSDPPTQAEMQAIADKIDEMITAQRRV